VRDDGQRPPTGVVTRTVRKGVEPQATTRLLFTGAMSYSQAERMALGALDDVLSIRLRDRIREALGGTYGVEVSTSAQKEPWASYQLAIGFGSSPERADELTAAVLKELEAIKATGPTADELQRVRETDVRELETAEKQNRWWLGTILDAVDRGEDLRAVVSSRRAFYQALTPQLVQAAAQKYLNTANYARFTLLPEKP
jgi:zinc protease